jgi:tetratricopeptide (TPR) repeat protein
MRLQRKRLEELLPYGVLIAAVLIAYANTLGNGFVLDDDTLIVNNRYLRDWQEIGRIFTTTIGSGAGTQSGFYRPLQILLYALIYWLGGAAPLGFHLLNAGLHAANTCLVYLLGRRLNFRPAGVFFAALLWGLHPIQTEAIANMSGTADVLYAFFCLLGAVVLLPDFSPRRMGVACVLFILGLLSKEAAIVFPLLAMSCLFLTSKRRTKPATYLCTWPLWLVALAYIGLRFAVLGAHSFDTNFGENLFFQYYRTHIFAPFYTFCATLPYYFGLLAWPVDLRIERQFPIFPDPLAWQVLVGLAILLLGAAQIIWGHAKHGLALSWGLLWFAAAFSLYTGIFVPLTTLFLEHWMYLPTVGLFLGLGQSCALKSAPYPALKRTAATASLALALIYGVMTHNQNGVWHDAFTLYPHILKYGEPSQRALNNLGKAYMERGDDRKALELFHQAVALSDTLPNVHQNIAYILVHQPGWQSHPREIIAELQRALAINPDFLPAYDGLAYVYAGLGDREQEAFYQKKANQLRRILSP